MGRVLVSVAGLLVVALFAALLAPLFVDWTDYRKDFEQQASQILGKKVIVAGDVSARILPFPSITLNDIRVGPDETGEALVTVAHFSMDAELAPFLSGEAKIFDMRIDQPKAKIRLLKDGTLDWVRTGIAHIPAKTVVLEHVSITGGEVDFIDEESGRTRQLRGLTANASTRSLTGPWRIDGTGALDGHEGKFSLSTGVEDNASEFRLKTRLEPNENSLVVELEGGLKIVDLKPRYDGQFTVSERVENDAKTGASAAASRFRIKGQFALTNESIDIPDYRLETGDAADPYVVTGKAKLDTGKVPQFNLEAEGQQIDVSRMGHDGETGKTSREANLSTRLRLQAMLSVLGDIPVPQVPGKASIKLPAVVAGDATMRNVVLKVRPNGQGWTVDTAEAELPGRTKVEVKGEVTLKGSFGFDGSVIVASTQPSGLATWLTGTVDPALRTVPSAGFSSNVHYTETLQRFDNLEIAIGPASMKGRVERQSPDNAVPTLAIELNGEKINYDELRAVVSLFSGTQSQGALFEHDIAAQISSRQFSAFGIDAETVKAEFTFAKGYLDLKQLDIGSLAGATIHAEGGLQDGEVLPTGTIKLRVSASDPGPALKILRDQWGGHPLLDRLVDSADHYAGMDLSGTLNIGETQDWPVKATMTGSVKGSKLEATYASEFLDFSPQSPFALDMTLSNPQMLPLLGQLGINPLPFDGDKNAVFTGHLARSGTGPVELTASLKADQFDLSADGQMAISADDFGDGQYDVSLQAGDLEPYLLMNGIGLPQTGSGLATTLKSRVYVLPDAISVQDLTAKFDDNDVSGTLELSRTGEPLQISGSLNFSNVDLPWLGEGLLGPLFSISDPGFSREPLPGSGLAGLTAQIDMRAKALDLGILDPFQTMSGHLSYDNGKLDLSKVAAEWHGGEASGQVSISNAGGTGRIGGQMTLTGADTSALSWSHDGQAVVRGRFDTTIALDASGSTVFDLVNSASGSGVLSLKDTEISGLDLSGFESITAAADLFKGDITNETILPLVTPLLADATMALGTVDIPFVLSSGKLQALAVKAKTARVDLSADAAITLQDLQFQAHMRAAFQPGDQAIDGAEPAIGLTWSGPLDKPQLQWDPSEMTGFLSLRMFERERRRVETMQANAFEKQRLRREVAYFKWLEAERLRLDKEAEMRKLEQEKRDAAEKAKADKAASEQAVPLTPDTVTPPPSSPDKAPLSP